MIIAIAIVVVAAAFLGFVAWAASKDRANEARRGGSYRRG